MLARLLGLKKNNKINPDTENNGDVCKIANQLTGKKIDQTICVVETADLKAKTLNSPCEKNRLSSFLKRKQTKLVLANATNEDLLKKNSQPHFAEKKHVENPRARFADSMNVSSFTDFREHMVKKSMNELCQVDTERHSQTDAEKSFKTEAKVNLVGSEKNLQDQVEKKAQSRKRECGFKVIWVCYIGCEVELERSKKSLKSLAETISKSSKAILTGSCSGNSFYLQLKRYWDTLCAECSGVKKAIWSVSPFPMRKDVAVDKAFKRIMCELSSLILDGDIILNSSDTASNLASILERNPDIGVLAPRQLEDDRHQHDFVKNQDELSHLVIPEIPQHVAGGCIMLKSKAFGQGYTWWHLRDSDGTCSPKCEPCNDEHKYDVDDALFHFKVHRDGFKVGIATREYVTHPFGGVSPNKDALAVKLHRANKIMLYNDRVFK